MIAWGRCAPVLALVLLGLDRAQGSFHRISTCSEWLAISTPLVEDTHVEVLQDIICESPRAVTVSGPYAYLVSSVLPSLTLTDLRFSIKNGADFFLNLSSDEYQGGSVAFVGTEPQRYHGGALKVAAGASATFGVPVTFADTSVVVGKRGGAVYNNGHLTFEFSAKFSGCTVMNPEGEDSASIFDPDGIAAASTTALGVASGQDDRRPVLHWGCGGGVYNGENGYVRFGGPSWFADNRAGDGSAGGALCNEGVAMFSSRTYFTGNMAAEHAEFGGGDGGAVYTAQHAITTLTRKANFRNNRSGGVGGAVHSAGVTVLQGDGVFRGNSALGRDGGRGGHVFALGLFEVKGETTFRSGRASQDGGAVFVTEVGEAAFNGNILFQDNYAIRNCHDVYDATSDVVCLPAMR